MVKPLKQIVFLALLFVGCGTDIKNVSFSREVQLILNRNCVACHSMAQHQGGIVLQSFNHLMLSRYLNRSTPLVIPGKSGESRLLFVVRSRNPAMRMPPEISGLPPLNENEIEVIRVWIDEGARNN